MQILCVCLTHNNNKNGLHVDGISGTCIFLQAGLWKQSAKKFPGLWKWFGKVSKILEAAEHDSKKILETLNEESFNNFGIIATNKVSTVQDGSRE